MNNSSTVTGRACEIKMKTICPRCDSEDLKELFKTKQGKKFICNLCGQQIYKETKRDNFKPYFLDEGLMDTKI